MTARTGPTVCVVSTDSAAKGCVRSSLKRVLGFLERGADSCRIESLATELDPIPEGRRSQITGCNQTTSAHDLSCDRMLPPATAYDVT